MSSAAFPDKASTSGTSGRPRPSTDDSSTLPTLASSLPEDIKGEEKEVSEMVETLKKKLIASCDAYMHSLEQQWADDDRRVGGAVGELPKREGLLGAASFKDDKLTGNATDAIIRQVLTLAEYNPNPDPCKGWGTPQTDHSRTPLHGLWKLRFTTAADATFKPGKRGKAVTRQTANATSGYFLNQISFPNNTQGKVDGFTVFVKGTPSTSLLNRMFLTFKRVEIYRSKSRFPKLFGKVELLLPNLLPLVNFFRKSDNQLELPYFDVLFLDDELRVHRTGENNYFVQTSMSSTP